MAHDSGAEFHTISVPDDFHYDAQEKFDLGYQRALFAEGLRIGQSGIWHRQPIDVPDLPSARGKTPIPAEEPRSTPVPRPSDKTPVASNRLSALGELPR